MSEQKPQPPYDPEHLTNTEDKLTFLAGAALAGLADAELERWTEERTNYNGELGEAVFEEQTSPTRLLANGMNLSYIYFGSQYPGEKLEKSYDITVQHGTAKHSLMLTDHNTVGYGIWDEHGAHIAGPAQEEILVDEAEHDPNFAAVVDFMLQITGEEASKPPRTVVIRNLPRVITSPDTTWQSPEQYAFPDSGYAEGVTHGQDAILYDESARLYGVFDGVGSNECSDIAARNTAAIVQEAVLASVGAAPRELETALVHALEQAAADINDMNYSNPAIGGTTATVGKLTEYDGKTYLSWASVGDSRLYLFTPDQGLKPITTDEGEGHVLHNSIGRGFHGVSQHGTFEVAANNQLLFCTDGVTGDYDADILSDQEIGLALQDGSTATEAATKLVTAARKHDDRSAVVVRV